MKLPDKIKIGGYNFKIEVWHSHAAQAASKYGEFSSHECTIRIDTSVNPQKVFECLLHEINHAVFWVYSIRDEDKEERICGTLASAYYQIFKDNPKFIRFLSGNIRRLVKGESK